MSYRCVHAVSSIAQEAGKQERRTRHEHLRQRDRLKAEVVPPDLEQPHVLRHGFALAQGGRHRGPRLGDAERSHERLHRLHLHTQ